MATKKEKIENILKSGVTDVIIGNHLKSALESGKKLRVKHGIDPTGPKIHLGRATALRKLAAFQELGHKIVLIIGDFTAQIGDASDKQAERKPLSREDVEKNMETYEKQLGLILDMGKVELHYNSEWHREQGKEDILRDAMHFTVAQMIERDNFWQRWEAKKPIGLHETLYPLLQGYDSVAIKADVEIGGNDQLFNMLCGRTMQKAYNQPPQDVLTTELMLGIDGRKMSTSWGNVILIEDVPDEMYGKIMRVPDNLIPQYFDLATDVSDKGIEEIKKALSDGENPRDIKARLAREIVTIYHDQKKALKAEENFNRVFQQGQTPQKMPVAKVKGKTKNILDLLVEAGLTSSKAEARRLVLQGGVRIDGQITEDREAKIDLKNGMVVQAGKRKFVKIDQK